MHDPESERLRHALSVIHEITQDTNVPCWQALQNIAATASAALHAHGQGEQIATVDGVAKPMPIDPAHEPMFLGDGGTNPRFDWDWWNSHRGTPSAMTVGK